ncbi:MAG: hypothetical protein WCI20_13250 [bacterium]
MKCFTLVALLASTMTQPVFAAESPSATQSKHRFLAVDTSPGRLIYVDEYDRSNDWSVAGTFSDLQLIGDHRVAVGDGAGVTIVDLKEKKIVGSVHPAKARGVHTFRWQADGRLIFVSGGMLTTDAAGVELSHVPMQLGARICRMTPEGGWVFGAGKPEVVETASDGTVKARYPIPGLKNPYIYHVAKREDGGFFASCGYAGTGVSLSATGAVLQRFEYPKTYFFGSLQVLNNGNVVFANWSGHGKPGDDARNPERGPQVIEFTADGKPVWTFHDAEKLNCINYVLVLDGLDLNLLHEEIGGRLVPKPKTIK